MLLNELHKRFQPIMDVNCDSFNPVPSAACLLDPVFAQVGLLLIPEQAPLLRTAKLMVISMCDNPVVPATQRLSQNLRMPLAPGGVSPLHRTGNAVKVFLRRGCRQNLYSADKPSVTQIVKES